MDRLLEVLREEIGIEDDEAGDVLQYPDTSETVNVSSLALMKMLKHCREGIPIEVMGLLVGTFLDDYTIDVIDVFAMPQKGTTITVESIDPCYQTEMLEMLKVAGRCEGIVGWYHSHPGFGCWLSSIDINTQQSFESLHPRAIAIVLDPVQSVKGKVNLEAFRLIDSSKINSLQLAPTSSARECTSNIGCLQNSESAIHDVGNKYYNMNVEYKLNLTEQKMLLSLNKKSWNDYLIIANENEIQYLNINNINNMLTTCSLEKHKNKICDEKKFNKEILKKSSNELLRRSIENTLKRHIILETLKDQRI